MKSGDILFVVGARPNFIKIAPICHALSKDGSFPFKIVHTGQHYDQNMSDVFFEELEIPDPDFFLNVGSGGHGEQTGKMMVEMEKLCLEHKFAAIVVIGDVNSTIAGALVGVKLHIPVVHVESGLRSFNRSMPEEINRIATDHISDILFAPTQLAMDNLNNEGLLERSFFSGDVMYDMILKGQQLAAEKSTILGQFGLEPRQFYLGTLHRPYNVDDPAQLKEIIGALSDVELPVILAAHPRLKKRLEEFNIKAGSNIHISEPLGYLDFVMLQMNAQKVVTDSGGVQKEAFFVQTPCVTLRSETEWVETVDTGANLLVQERSKNNILQAVEKEQHPRYHEKPYGDGNASGLIINTIKNHLTTN